MRSLIFCLEDTSHRLIEVSTRFICGDVCAYTVIKQKTIEFNKTIKDILNTVVEMKKANITFDSLTSLVKDINILTPLVNRLIYVCPCDCDCKLKLDCTRAIKVFDSKCLCFMDNGCFKFGECNRCSDPEYGVTNEFREIINDYETPLNDLPDTHLCLIDDWGLRDHTNWDCDCFCLCRLENCEDPDRVSCGCYKFYPGYEPASLISIAVTRLTRLSNDLLDSLESQVTNVTMTKTVDLKTFYETETKARHDYDKKTKDFQERINGMFNNK